uniref:Myb/SANT-like domain-containing protein n=1 Tax=Ananas comosus var. bracteatus TaxID=296719 RepID=A0A6V7PGM6_ANACO|nr:unnamed protein product [Ananas comosus var. bracteatus]
MATSSSTSAPFCLSSSPLGFVLLLGLADGYASCQEPSKFAHKKGVVFETTLMENLHVEGSSRLHNQSWKRTPNWTESMNATMLSLLTKEHALGNYTNGSFTNIAWIRIITDFNSRTNMNLTREQIKNRLKVLKRMFYLANKSGWGWDYVQNIPTTGDQSDWDAIIVENPAYAKCRDKPFPAYKDIAFLTAKSTATGRYDFLTGIAAVPTIDSSSSPSPGEDEGIIGERMSAFNLEPTPFEAGSSGSAFNANLRSGNNSRSPSPTDNPTTTRASASGFGHGLVPHSLSILHGNMHRHLEDDVKKMIAQVMQ